MPPKTAADADEMIRYALAVAATAYKDPKNNPDRLMRDILQGAADEFDKLFPVHTCAPRGEE